MRWKLTTVLPVSIGLVAVVVLYGRLLVPGTAYVDRDISGMHLPMLSDLARAMEDGVPYWNPLVHGGQPLLTNPHYAAFYPPSWLVLILPAHYLIGLLIVLHVLWAFTGSWKLARHWGCDPPAAGLAALAFVGGGAFCSAPSLLNMFMGLAWVPWVLLWGDRALQQKAGHDWLASGAGLAIALACQLLTGSPETALLSVLALVCLATELLPGNWRRILRLVPVGLVGLGLAAVQIVPTVRHLTASARSAGLQTEMATTWSTPPVRFVELLWPRLFGDPGRADSFLYFGYPGSKLGIPLILSIYCGALIVALAAGLGPGVRIARRRALLCMMIVGAFLALGRYNPIYTAVILHIPPFSLIRFPEKFILLTTTALALLAASSWQNMLAAPVAASKRGSRNAIIVTVLALSGAVFLYFAPLVAPDLTMELIEGVTPETLSWQDQPDRPDVIPEEVVLVRAGLLGKELFVSAVLWVVTLLVLLLHRKAGIPRGVLVAAVLAVLGLDLAYYGWRWNLTVPASAVLEPPAGLANLPPSTGRVFSDFILFGNTVVHLPEPGAEIPTKLTRSLQRLDPYTANIWGYGYALNQDPDLMLTGAAQHALRVLIKKSGLWQQGWTEEVYRFLGAWNVGIVVRRRSPAAQLEERQRTGRPPAPATLMPNPHVLPKYRMVSTVARVGDLDSAVERVRSVDFRLAKFDAVIRDSPGAADVDDPFDPEARILSITDESSHIMIDYQASEPAFLVAAITADRDWTASVGADDLPIRTTALGQMGIELPAGRHRLRLVHRNPTVLWGAATSTLCLVACLVVVIRRRGNRGN